MQITFTIQIDTDDKDKVVVKNVVPQQPAQPQQLGTATSAKIEGGKPNQHTELKVSTKPVEAVKAVKKPVIAQPNKEVTRSGNKAHKGRTLAPLPDDQLIPADFQSKYVVIPTDNPIQGVAYPPYIARTKSDDEFRTAERPYLGADVKQVMSRFGVSIPELAKAIGMTTLDIRNLLTSDSRMFTKQEYFVILKAINNVLESKSILEDLI